jgi:hypothetical protein
MLLMSQTPDARTRTIFALAKATDCMLNTSARSGPALCEIAPLASLSKLEDDMLIRGCGIFTSCSATSRKRS